MDKVINCGNNTNVKEILCDIKGGTSNHRDSSLSENIVSISNLPCELIQRIALQLNHMDYCSLRSADSSFENKLNAIQKIVQDYKCFAKGALHDIYHDFLNKCPIWKAVNGASPLYKYTLSNIHVEKKRDREGIINISIFDCFYEGDKWGVNNKNAIGMIILLHELIIIFSRDNVCEHHLSSRLSKWDSHKERREAFFCVFNSLEFRTFNNVIELNFLLDGISRLIRNNDLCIEYKMFFSVVMGELKKYCFQNPIGNNSLQEVSTVFNLYAEEILIGEKALHYMN